MDQFRVPGMTCAGCLRGVTKAFEKLDQQAHVEGSLEQRTITVASDKSASSLLAALENAGYPAQLVSVGR